MMDYRKKERFVTPRVIFSVEIESEEELLVGSGGSMEADVTATGHETYDGYTVGDYWE